MFSQLYSVAKALIQYPIKKHSWTGTSIWHRGAAGGTKAGCTMEHVDLIVDLTVDNSHVHIDDVSSPDPPVAGKTKG